MGSETTGILKALLNKGRHEYESRRVAAEKQVVRWEHWSGPAYDSKPFYFERALKAGLVKRGKPLPRATARSCSYGFDGQGRVVIDRQPTDADGEPAYDEFFVRTRSGIESAAYERDGKNRLLYVTLQAHRAGRPVSTDVLDASGKASHSERYTWRGDRLTGIDVTSVAGKDKREVKYDLVYERDGRLRTIRRHHAASGLMFPIYWNPASGETLESLTTEMRASLLKVIPEAVKRAKIKQPAYCLALVYDTDNEELPPLLGVGLEEERRSWTQAEGKSARELIWNSDEFKNFAKGPLDLDDIPLLKEQSEKLLQIAFLKEELSIPQRLLNDVAADLNRRSWKGILPTTDDFVVYAVDSDAMDLASNLKAAVPVRQRKLLKSRGML